MYPRMMVQDPRLQSTEAQALAREVAVSVSPPLARFVPSAPAHSDPSIDRWVEREQRRCRKCKPAVLMILVLLAVAAILFVRWS